MKYLAKFVLLAFIYLSCAYANAEQKTVILDLNYLLNKSKAGKDAQDFLKKSFENNAKKFKDQEKDLKKEETDLLSQKSSLSKEDYEKKSDKLRKKVIKYQSDRRVSLEKIATLRTNSRNTLIKKTEEILNDYIKSNDISLVVDKKMTLGGNPDLDITDVIVKKLNKELLSLNLK